MEVADHTFLITGGASGLGEACCRQLISAGGSVLIADINEEAGKLLADELGSAARFATTDVTDEASMQSAIDLATSEFGRLDGAVLCAGVLGASRVIGRSGPHDLDLFRRVVEVNLIGTFNAMRLVSAAISAAASKEEDGTEQPADGERGVIVMTSSVAAFEGQLGQAAYSASKGGVASLTLPAARELGRYGIRVVSIAPGVFETPMMAAVTDELRTSLESQVPFPPRLGKPGEFAQLAQQIIENRMLNGTVIRLDGALRMGSK